MPPPAVADAIWAQAIAAQSSDTLLMTLPPNVVRLSRTIFRRGTRVKLHDRAWARLPGAQAGPVQAARGLRSAIASPPVSALPCVRCVRSRRDRFGRDFFAFRGSVSERTRLTLGKVPRSKETP